MERFTSKPVRKASPISSKTPRDIDAREDLSWVSLCQDENKVDKWEGEPPCLHLDTRPLDDPFDLHRN